MRHMLHDREVVGDEQHREAEFLLQILQQVDDLRLHRDVERADRFVADDQVGIGRERAGDADALALAAGEFMRPAANRIPRQPHLVHQAGDPRFQIGGILRHAEIADRFRQDVAHPHAGVEAAVGILKHHLHAPPQRAQGGRGHVVDARAVQDHLAAGQPEQPQHRLADGGFAAARFAHQRQRLALRDVEGHAIHRIDIAGGAAEEAAAQREVLLEVVDLKYRGVHAASAPSRSA